MKAAKKITRKVFETSYLYPDGRREVAKLTMVAHAPAPAMRLLMPDQGLNHVVELRHFEDGTPWEVSERFCNFRHTPRAFNKKSTTMPGVRHIGKWVDMPLADFEAKYAEAKAFFQAQFTEAEREPGKA